MRPITMQVNYTLTNTAVPFSPDDLEPVLDDYIPTTVTAQVCVLHVGVICTVLLLKSQVSSRMCQ